MPKKRIPTYRHHKPSGHAVVTLKGKDFYLGKYNSEESWAEYNKLINSYTANQCKLPPTRTKVGRTTVENFALAYLDKVAERYVGQSGRTSATYDHCRLALSPLIQHYGRFATAELGPESLEFLQKKWVMQGLARQTINRWCAVVKKALKWGVSRGLVEAEVYHVIDTVENIQIGQTDAPEYREIPPVPDDVVEATLPHLPPIVADMVRVQRLGGWRPQDVCNMRLCDIDRTDDVWVYRPFTHKNKHRGKKRVLPIGPRGQAILGPYIDKKADTPEAFLFSPADSVQLWQDDKRTKRKTKVQPSQACRKKAQPKSLPKDHYTKDSYNRAVQRAIQRAGVDHWTPNQLRHARLTEVRNKKGLEYAQAVGGHANAKTTEIYAAIQFEKSLEMARESG